ncbi:primosomal protein N' [Motiliproteus sp. SC1-56]|uniref:primosomal protein N' n=1 Tax=Motiliproteus sp. SC1-56 TaxID=2799565 RepID=UPI001A8F1448|nr:primosomal protein N' [Motiliproteus sp. SC1-56]
MTPELFLRLALPSPLRRSFDYLPPEGVDPRTLQPGVRLRVPFGRRELVGVLLEVADHSEVPADKLRPAIACLDNAPLLPAHLLVLARWAAAYYQHPVGDALFSLLPAQLRQGVPAAFRHERLWVARSSESAALARAPRQQELLALIVRHPDGISLDAIKALGYAPGLLRNLAERGLVEAVTRELQPAAGAAEGELLHESPLTLNREQQEALAALAESGDRFGAFLLQGVTGSGKTEVYLQAIERVLKQGRQALVLVPEIGLTPQTVGRFRQRFNVPVEVLHSGLNDRERLDAWLKAREGLARILIGTRSALLTPLKNPGLIVIDEEHDGSFKQQEGFRYSARDLAVMRARAERIPIVLGSATPSLETLSNAQSGRYHWLQMKSRAGGARPPAFELLDIRGLELDEGLCASLLNEIGRHLARGEQVLVFLNRRGFAPTLMCHDCGWIADCPQCDAHMTLHRRPPHLHCHHCDFQSPLQPACPECQSRNLNPVGAGTERTEESLARHFPEVPVLRVDRDSTRRKDAMAKILARVHQPGPCLLVGTQMLAKGHHFPRVTLVAILDADAGLFSADFRGMEKMGQLLLQVAGRSGRAETPGRVLMQTLHADHPRLRTLVEEPYEVFAGQELAERRLAQLPPYSHLALLRAEAISMGRAEAFLQMVRALVEPLCGPELVLLGPLPSPMELRAGRYRAQLLLQCARRGPLQGAVGRLALLLENNPQAKKVRWSIDIDPQDMF